MRPDLDRTSTDRTDFDATGPDAAGPAATAPNATGPAAAGSFFARLRGACPSEWEAYVDHAFVRGLGDGSLPIEAFRDYLAQDYVFLVHFARAHALAAYKSRSLTDIRQNAEGLSAILDETRLHVRLAEGWGISAAELEATPEKQATVAYTRFVLDCGMAGDLLDLEVALAPCVIGYAEIGARLAGMTSGGDVGDGSPGLDAHPYREWIGEYAGAEYQESARAAAVHLDTLADGEVSERRLAELTETFRTATRLEADFWGQALAADR